MIDSEFSYWDYFKKIRMTEGFTKLLWGRLEFRRNERIITKLFWGLLEVVRYSVQRVFDLPITYSYLSAILTDDTPMV